MMGVRATCKRLLAHLSPPLDSAKRDGSPVDLFQSWRWPSENETDTAPSPVQTRRRTDTTTTRGSIGSFPPSTSPTLFLHSLPPSSPTAALCPLDVLGSVDGDHNIGDVYRYLASVGLHPSPHSQAAEVSRITYILDLVLTR